MELTHCTQCSGTVLAGSLCAAQHLSQPLHDISVGSPVHSLSVGQTLQVCLPVQVVEQVGQVIALTVPASTLSPEQTCQELCSTSQGLVG